MEAIETLRYIEYLKPKGTIILNHYLWQPVQSTFIRVSNLEQKYISIGEIIQKLKVITNNVHLIDALDLANRSGNPLTSNVVLIGALARLDQFPIPLDSLKEVIALVVPKKAIDANLHALDLGFNVLNKSL
jgi:Pyruvate/2-oxoacid:ferredoxin oxidoreductase gamma subunit